MIRRNRLPGWRGAGPPSRTRTPPPRRGTQRRIIARGAASSRSGLLGTRGSRSSSLTQTKRGCLFLRGRGSCRACAAAEARREPRPPGVELVFAAMLGSLRADCWRMAGALLRGGFAAVPPVGVAGSVRLGGPTPPRRPAVPPNSPPDVNWADADPVLQRADAPDRAVRAPRSGAGDDVQLRADGLRLCPHRKLQDVSVCRRAAALSGTRGLRRAPGDEPDRRGAHDRRPAGRRRGGRQDGGGGAAAGRGQEGGKGARRGD